MSQSGAPGHFPELQIAPDVVPPSSPPRMRFNWRINAVLLLATIVTVAGTGLIVWGSPWQFAAALLAILLVHEGGHYVAARLHHVPTSLPYFLPLPVLNPFGTLGAIIIMPERIRSRRALMDIGAAGPLAGMAVAVPLMVVGLHLSKLGPRITVDYIQEGQSLLYWALKAAVFGHIRPDQDVMLHPVALAAWAGFLVTFLNLLPLSQLDGGHVAYALFGERQNRVARWVLWSPVALLAYNAWVFARPVVLQALAEHSWAPFGRSTGMLVSSLSNWVVPLVLFLVIRRRGWLDHPPVDDHTLPLGRKLVGVVTLAVFVALFMPSPWVVY
jgi:membrane-associated protease RseP (regulator of RpoE activity)